jgi:arylsulfatase A-like enzyme
MNRREFLQRMTACAAATTLGGVAFGKDGGRDGRPNILLIFLDDMGFGDIGCHGCKDIPTPNIDALAAGGVLFTNGYVTGPQCLPSRAGLFSGQYQQRMGCTGNQFPPKKGAMQASMATVLQKAGYACAGIGKLQAADGLSGLSVKITNPRALASKAVAFMEENREHPFFFYYAPRVPHVPLRPQADTLARFEHIKDTMRRKYAAMVYEIDLAVGMMMDGLARLGLPEKTLVFFINDNGGPEKGGNGSNASENDPLRGRKTELFEGGIKVPFIASWKGTVPAGLRYEHPVIALDVHATAAAVSGASLPAGFTPDGVNLIPFLKGEKKERPHEALFWMNRYSRSATHWWAVRQGDEKLLVRDQEVMLFNLKTDPCETNDLAGQQPGHVAALSATLASWLDSLPESVPRCGAIR